MAPLLRRRSGPALYLSELPQRLPRAPRPARRPGAGRGGARDRSGCLRPAWGYLWLFMDTSSVHGFSHLTATGRSPWERVLWIIFMALAFSGAVSIALSTWHRYQENPTVISMERGAHEWNTSFPSATVCPTTAYSEEAVRKAVESYGGNHQDQLETFFKLLFEVSYETFGNFKKINNTFSDYIKPSEYQDKLTEYRFDFTYRMVSSVTDSPPEVWLHLTEMGICYTSNNQIASQNDPDVWAKRKKPPKKIVLLSGNVLDGDMFSQMMDMNSASNIYVHGPNEIPDCASRKHELPSNVYKNVDVTGLALYTSDEARTLSVKQRRCRFPDESNLKISSAYSYNLCRMQCRMTHAYSLCKCVPFFYRRYGKYDVCDPEGMLCLSKYEDYLIRLLDPITDEKVRCDCLPSCDTTNFVVESESDMSWPLGTNFKWSIVRYPQMRLRRDVLFGFTDVLVSIGGTAGLFLGCSILSFMEIVYFCTLRLFWYLYSYSSIRNRN